MIRAATIGAMEATMVHPIPRELPIQMGRNRSLLHWAIFMALLCFNPALTLSVSAEELVVQADRWCPYNCVPGAPAPGYVIEVLQAVFEPAGTKIHYQIVPWDRTLMQTRDGKASAAIGATQPEVDEFGLLVGSEAIGYSSDCLYVAANSTVKLTKADDLASLKRIGVASGYTYSDDLSSWLNRAENKGKIFVQKGEVPSETNARNLALGRLDGVIEDNHVMQQVIFRFGLERQLVLAGCLQQTKIFVAFSPKLKNAESFVKQLDEGIVALRQTGRLARILGKYGLTDWR